MKITQSIEFELFSKPFRKWLKIINNFRTPRFWIANIVALFIKQTLMKKKKLVSRIDTNNS